MSNKITQELAATKAGVLDTNAIIFLKRGHIMSIGERIRTLRKELNVTQNQFGKKLGIHGRQLARYEEGINIPSVDTLIKIANFCEVSLDYLAYGHDKKIAKRSKINDMEILDLLRKIDCLKKSDRDKLKWALQGLLNCDKK